jgi:hypothetical protein
MFKFFTIHVVLLYLPITRYFVPTNPFCSNIPVATSVIYAGAGWAYPFRYRFSVFILKLPLLAVLISLRVFAAPIASTASARIFHEK